MLALPKASDGKSLVSVQINGDVGVDYCLGG
jgi:hypothetical protein